jgi:hypothetical protein
MDPVLPKEIGFYLYRETNTSESFVDYVFDVRGKNSDAVSWKSKSELVSFWGGPRTIHFATDTEPDAFMIPAAKVNYKTPTLSCALRKSIALCNPDCSMNIAWQFIKQDIKIFFFELPIIMMETACLHPMFDFAVWMMASIEKGYFPTKSQIISAIMIVYDISICRYRDPVLDTPNNARFFNPIVDNESDKKKKTEIRYFESAIAAMILRSNHGGKKKDMDLMRQFSLVWYERITKLGHEKCEGIITKCYPWFPLTERRENYKERHISKDISLFDCITGLVDSDNQMSKPDEISQAIDIATVENMADRVYQKLSSSQKDYTGDFFRRKVASTILHHRTDITKKKIICMESEPLNLCFPDYVNEEKTNEIKETGPMWVTIRSYLNNKDIKCLFASVWDNTPNLIQ